MPFAIEVKSLDAPTEIYERLGDKTPEGWERETKVLVVVATYKNSINWLVLGEMNKDGQKFRDEIYACAALAHNQVDRGCGKYYRGTNSVHVKRLHSDPFESMYNHNHYPLGGKLGADFDVCDFPDDVTPAEFRAHVMEFARQDAKMHGGKSRFLSEKKAAKLADEFDKNYINEMSTPRAEEPLTRKYSDEDIRELIELAHQEKPCKTPEGSPLNTRGIGSELADDRQPEEYSLDTYQYVLDFREQGKQLLKDIEATVAEVEEKARLEECLNEVISEHALGTKVAIASAAFGNDVVEDIALHAELGLLVAAINDELRAEETKDVDRTYTYNTSVIRVLEHMLLKIDEGKAPLSPGVIGQHQYKQQTHDVQREHVIGLIEECIKYGDERAIDFEEVLSNYQAEEGAIRPKLVESLRSTIHAIEKPINSDMDRENRSGNRPIN